MSNARVFCFLSILLSVITGCAETEQELSNAMDLPDTLYLSATDSIGVEMGDSTLMLGSISGVGFTPGGNVLVADMVSADIREFARDGSYIRTISRKGSGPGELSMPLSMAVTATGRILIADQYAGGIHAFSPEGGWEGLQIDYAGQSTPHEITGTDDEVFAGSLISFVQEYEGEQGLFSILRIGRFTTEILPDVVYLEDAMAFDPTDITSLLKQTAMGFAFTADRQGNVYIAPTNSEEYRIDCFRPDGELYMTISNEFQRVEKEEWEIELERNWINNTLQEMGSEGVIFDYQPDIYRSMIAYSGLGVDSLRRIWVRRGTEDSITFDVYDQEGKWILVAVLEEFSPEEIPMMVCRVFEGGILAYSLAPQICQRLYLIE